MNIIERFLNYTKFDTQSAEESQSVPSTAKQLVFARYLKEELEHEGLEDVEMDKNGYIYATLPANGADDAPVIGFISHYDTSPDASGCNIKPRIVNNYDGGDIELHESMMLSPTAAGRRRQSRHCRDRRSHGMAEGPSGGEARQDPHCLQSR